MQQVLKLLWTSLRIFVVACLPIFSSVATAQDDQPNIVLILVDDAALMDFGAYGGEALTPNIDALAARGAMFTNFHASPMCAPSRAMLMTGMDSHSAGVANLPEFLPESYRDKPGYSGHLEPGVTTLASYLKAAGYRTYMTGKWHLGHGEGDLPNSHGFDRSFVLDASGADNWKQQAYIAVYEDDLWFEDGQKATLPDNFYSSEFLVDQMIDYVGDDTSDAPFFAYVAFQAIHIPIQAPAEFTAHYQGVYDGGWDALRTARWQRAQELGLIPEDAPMAPMPESMRGFETIPDDERALLIKSMAVNAGMLEAMDYHLGRLIASIEARGELDNTVFVVTSDNGPASSDPLADNMLRRWIKGEGYHFDLETLGERGSYAAIGPEWASAAAAPSAFFKFYAAEGGVRVPMIIAGKDIQAEQVSARSFITDIAPTLLELAGADPVPAMSGRTLLPVITGIEDSVYGPNDVVAMEAAGQAMVFKGDLKLTRNMPPYGDGVWRLHNLANDPGETIDLATSQPEDFAAMMADYEAYAARVGVLEMPEGYETHKQLRKHAISLLLKQWAWLLALIGLAVLGGLFWLFRTLRKRLRRGETT